MTVFIKELLIQNRLGLHARAAIKLVHLANRFNAKITISQGEKEASADSVVALLMLESSMGKHITVSTRGKDAEAALLAVEQLINHKFDEQ
jgi:phosphocarrier protein NPr